MYEIKYDFKQDNFLNRLHDETIIAMDSSREGLMFRIMIWSNSEPDRNNYLIFYTQKRSNVEIYANLFLRREGGMLVENLCFNELEKLIGQRGIVIEDIYTSYCYILIEGHIYNDETRIQIRISCEEVIYRTSVIN